MLDLQGLDVLMDVFPLFSVAAAHDRERVHDESLDVPQVAEVSWHVSSPLLNLLVPL